MRICSFVPSGTEILYALGVGDQVVGVSHECDFPEDARTKPRMTRSLIDATGGTSEEIDRQVQTALAHHQPLYQINEALLRQAEPDLVVTQALCEVCAIGSDDVRDALRSLADEPRVLSLHPHTLAEALEDIDRLGEATHRHAQAERLVRSFRARLERVRVLLDGLASRPRVFCLEWLAPPMAVGHWVPEMVERAGGVEILGRAGQASRYVTGEEIVAARPDVVILMPCGFAPERTRQELPALTAQSWWRELAAVREQQVYVVDGPAYFNGAGPRLIDGIERLAALLHPDRCAHVAPPGERASARL